MANPLVQAGAAAFKIGAPAAIDFGLGSVASKTAWSRTKRMMQKRHLWEVADLRSAGLNPILSAGAAPSMGGPSMQQTPDIAAHEGVRQKKRQDRAGRKTMRHQRGAMDAQKEAALQAAGLSNAAAAKTREEAGLINTQHRIAALGVAQAELNNEVALSASGRAAAYAGAWANTISAVSGGVGAAAMWRLGGGRGGAAQSTAVKKLNLGQSTSKHRLGTKGTKSEAWKSQDYNPQMK